MINFATYVALVIVIIGVCVIWVIAFGVVYQELHNLYRLIRAKRRDRKILKTAERCRRDFA